MRFGNLQWWNSLAGVMTAIATLFGLVALVVTVAAWRWPQQPEAAPSPAASSAGPSLSPSDSPSPSPTPPSEVARTPRLGLEFWQGQQLSPMRVDRGTVETVYVTMRDEPFFLRFPRPPKDLAVQICAFTDPTIFNLRDGLAVADTEQFAPGMGMADSDYSSGRLNLVDVRNNYFVDTRIQPYSTDLGQIYISTIAARREAPGATGDVYLTVFVDRDRDKVVDFGEYEYLVLDYPS
ncbi:hypothetical protein HDA40_000619 [Hamadaea flava]|uniref:Uncharacterized protein n=1 Tax=Hamadaea flava TaxID=1742688 RepID=A0ABV8M0I2_9ACTN|nr:hypothetical protein [Hamadaea flava]MCP2322112.1 hypothetical protein [Hamadaea flava]